jgi:hypothetical protein
MRRRLYYSILLIAFTTLVLTQLTTVNSYDELYGVEYGDIVDVAFESWINGEFSNNFTDDGAFRVTVDPDVVNYNFVDELVTMKIGEVKPYITWFDGEGNLIEYYNTKIVRLVKDISPNTPLAWKIIRPILITMVSIGVVVGGIYSGVKIRQRIGIKGCFSCDNKATSKCSKCGTSFCPNCSSKGCTNCGSRQFIRN